jgi:Ferritin-like domain/TAT (twin-arginine translocation) pathway signal sequence
VTRSGPVPALGGITRRWFLQIGGTVTLGAALAACLGDGGDTESQEDTGGAEGRRIDITITRTLSSLEELAVAVYQTGLDSALLMTPAVIDLANLFRSHHREHAALFRGATEDLGGAPLSQPNRAVMQQLQPELDGLRDEAGVVRLAFDVENILAQTYQATMGAFGDRSFNVAAMGVGGAEARHAAAFAQVLRQPPVPGAFQGTEAAVPVGTGV